MELPSRERRKAARVTVFWGREEREFSFGHVKFGMFTKHLSGSQVGSWSLEFGREN